MKSVSDWHRFNKGVSVSYRECENCGTRLYRGMCQNCHEELYILETQSEYVEQPSEEFLAKAEKQRQDVYGF